MIPTSKINEEETSILTIDTHKQYILNISVNGVIKEIIHNGNMKYKDLKPIFGLYENRIIRDRNNKINNIISSDICYSNIVILIMKLFKIYSLSYIHMSNIITD